MQVDESACVSFEDTWGPYKTEQNCKIRTDQMVLEAGKEDITIFLASLLGFPPAIQVKGYCSAPEGTPT
jgi:hypothetical protein